MVKSSKFKHIGFFENLCSSTVFSGLFKARDFVWREKKRILDDNEEIDSLTQSVKCTRFCDFSIPVNFSARPITKWLWKMIETILKVLLWEISDQSLLQMDDKFRAFIEAGYQDAAYKTSYRCLSSLRIGSLVWVSPYGTAAYRQPF